MSQTAKIHKLTIKNKAPGTISTCRNTQVLLDDKPLLCKFFKIEGKVKGVVKITLELFAEVEVDGIVTDRLQTMPSVPKATNR